MSVCLKCCSLQVLDCCITEDPGVVFDRREVCPLVWGVVRLLLWGHGAPFNVAGVVHPLLGAWFTLYWGCGVPLAPVGQMEV